MAPFDIDGATIKLPGQSPLPISSTDSQSELEPIPIRLAVAVTFVVAALLLVAAVGMSLSAYLKKAQTATRKSSLRLKLHS